MKLIIRKSYSDTEVGSSNNWKPHKKCKLKSKRKVKKELQRSLSQNAQEEREREKLRRSRQKLRAQGSLESPYNTPYLAVSDHSAHHSSPDPESFYSQTDSQLEDFVGREFRKDYDLQLYERLERMSKEMLMSEYLLMEKKIEQLEQKISEDQRREERQGTAQSFGLITVFPLIQRLAEEFNILKSQNEKLLGQNSALCHKLYSISV